MSKLKITNFSKMHPDVPEYSNRNQIFSMSGVDPLYYLAQSTVQEKRNAPLAASRTFQSVATFLSPLTAMVPSSIPTFDVVLSTQDGFVKGAGNGSADFGQPIVLGSNISPRISIYGGFIYWIYSGSSNIFYKDITLPSSGWNIASGLVGTNSYVRYMKPFLDFLAISDNDGTSKNANHIVRKIDKSNLVTLGIDLGVGWNINMIENYNQRYLAVVASYSGDGTAISGLNSDINYLFLWNGITSRYNTSVRIPGQFVDIKNVGDKLYVVVFEKSGQNALYELSGNSFKRLFRIGLDTVKNSQGNALFNYTSLVGINLSSKGQYLFDEESKYILTAQDFDILQRAGSSGTLYGSKGSSLSSYQTVGYSNISMVTQWIPFKDLTSLVIKYATAPNVGDSIQVTLSGYDEDGLASSALPLTTITSVTKYNSYKTYLDCQGFQGNEVQITLTTVSTSGWQPIIREIELIN